MAGQQDLASKSSRTTLILNNVALGIGLAVYILTIILSMNAYHLPLQSYKSPHRQGSQKHKTDGRYTSEEHEIKEITSTRKEMYNQGPAIGRINFSFSDPEEQNPSAKPRMNQPLSPPGSYPNSSSYPLQPYGAPVSPQGPYTQQQSYPAMSAYPERQNAGHTGVTVQPTVIMTSTPAPVHMSEYLCYSIFNLIFCFFPLGLAAVIYSASTRDANLAGRQDLAIRSSRTALILNNVALGFGLAIYTVVTILLLRVYGVIK